MPPRPAGAASARRARPTLLRLLAPLAIAAAVARCSGGDGTAPTAPPARSVQAAVRVAYSAQAQQFAGVAVDTARVTVLRPQANRQLPPIQVLQQVAPFPADQNQLQLRLLVPLAQSPETLLVRLELLGQGTVLFTGQNPFAFTATGGTTQQPTVTLSYVGPGTNLATLTVSPFGLTVPGGDSLLLDVTAADGQGLSVPLFYTSFSTTNPNITINANGLLRVSRNATRGTSRIVVTAPNGTQGETSINTTPPVQAIQKLAGDGLVVRPGSYLPNGLAVKVTATDGQPIAGARVTFQATSGGIGFLVGDFTQPFGTAITDTGGRAFITTNVGSAGPTTATASIGGVTATFSLTSAIPVTIAFGGDSAGGNPRVIEAARTGDLNILQFFGGGREAFPRFNPARDRLVYSSRNPFVTGPTPNQLVVLDPATGASATIVTDTSTFRPRYNRDGTRVAFGCGAAVGVGDVCVVSGVNAPIVNLPGIGDGFTKYLTQAAFFGRRVSGAPAFGWDPRSPDSLAVVRDTIIGNTAASGLYLVRFDGAGGRRINANAANVLVLGPDTLRVDDLEWDPNGNFLVLQASSFNGGQGLYRINRDGSGLTRLTTTTAGLDFAPSVSPDGTQVLFFRGNPDGPVFGGDFFRVPSTGGAAVQATNEDLFSVTDASQVRGDWSPDGTEIVVVGRGTNQEQTLYRIKATTTAATYAADRVRVGRVGPGIADAAPSWRP